MGTSNIRSGRRNIEKRRRGNEGQAVGLGGERATSQAIGNQGNCDRDLCDLACRLLEMRGSHTVFGSANAVFTLAKILGAQRVWNICATKKLVKFILITIYAFMLISCCCPCDMQLCSFRQPGPGNAILSNAFQSPEDLMSACRRD